MFGLRLLRRRSVLAAIFFCSLFYFTASLLKRLHNSAERQARTDAPPPPRLSLDAVNWQISPDSPANQTQGGKPVCRNSVQGKQLIVDEEGYVCERPSLTPGGCCARGAGAALVSKRFSCTSCKRNACCSVYEHCVACCLNPDKRPLLKRVFTRTANAFKYLFGAVEDVFEFCLAKCRTNSQSVQHENTYRNPSAKYCYGEQLPAAQRLN